MAITTIDAAGSDPIEILQANGAGTEVLRVTSAGNVGIGITSPGYALHVNGESQLITSSAKIVGNVDSANYNIVDSGAGQLRINWYGGVAIPNGKVGIGTTTPAARLHVKCDGSSTDQLRLENSGTNGKVWAISGGLDSAPGDLTVRNQTDGKTIAAFHYNSDDDIRALHIGPGNETPNYGMDVIGVGERSDILGGDKDGYSMTMRVVHTGRMGELAVTCRNEAGTGAYTGGYLIVRKVPGYDKGTMELATWDGSWFCNNAIFIDPNGKIGFGTNTPTNPIEHASGARLSTAFQWVDGSSREIKKDITQLEHAEAFSAFMAFNPVKYRCKMDMEGKQVLGFIAEDVPELVATKDRKGLSPMNIVAVLTKVVQGQQKKIDELEAALKNLAVPKAS